MSFSVGILYSAQEFASYVAENTIAVDEFENTFRKYSLAKPQDILEVCVRCNWINFQPDGICRITDKGKLLLLNNAEKSLRIQIRDLISTDEPSWAIKIPNGRQETMKFLPPEVFQCFKEAGLLQNWDDDVISWWDRLAIATRTSKIMINLESGRLAEKLTMTYETKRIGSEPHWQSIESNFSGYDILSKSDKDSPVSRMIEVKGSTLPRKEAFCFVTRNEWNTAQLANDYHFHLWCLRGDKPYLIDVSADEMKSHIPADNGNGKWETTKVPFKSFY